MQMRMNEAGLHQAGKGCTKYAGTLSVQHGWLLTFLGPFDSGSEAAGLM